MCPGREWPQPNAFSPGLACQTHRCLFPPYPTRSAFCTQKNDSRLRFLVFPTELLCLRKMGTISRGRCSFSMETSGKGSRFQNNLSTYTCGVLVPVAFVLEMGNQAQHAQATRLVSCRIESRKLKARIHACCLSHSCFLVFLWGLIEFFKHLWVFFLAAYASACVVVFHANDMHTAMNNQITVTSN